MAGKVKAVSFIRDAFLANRFSEGPKEVIATKDYIVFGKECINQRRREIRNKRRNIF